MPLLVAHLFPAYEKMHNSPLYSKKENKHVNFKMQACRIETNCTSHGEEHVIIKTRKSTPEICYISSWQHISSFFFKSISSSFLRTDIRLFISFILCRTYILLCSIGNSTTAQLRRRRCSKGG